MIAGHEYLEFRDGEIFVHNFYTGAVRRWKPPADDGKWRGFEEYLPVASRPRQQQAEMPLAA